MGNTLDRAGDDYLDLNSPIFPELVFAFRILRALITINQSIR